MTADAPPVHLPIASALRAVIRAEQQLTAVESLETELQSLRAR